MAQPLKLREDGTFTIVQLTDMHYGDYKEEERESDDRTAALVEKAIREQQPDLVVLTGDMIWSDGVEDPQAAIRRAIAPVIASGVPWAAVFGNHDAEGIASRDEMLAIMQESASCLAVSGPSDINGVGNYVLNVSGSTGSSDAAALYFFDSGIEAPEPVGGWAYVHPDQIQWYAGESRKRTENNGGPVPSLAFLHIPFPEYKAAWEAENVTGVKGEEVEGPRINTGLFGTMVHMGDVIGTFAGHDHDNDYCGTMHGIRMCYGRVTGFNCYGKLPRGVRVIRLTEGARKFETWIAQEDGKVVAE